MAENESFGTKASTSSTANGQRYSLLASEAKGLKMKYVPTGKGKKLSIVETDNGNG
ncbi:MAG: hypothetical protein IJU19_00065 [Bacteroidales bacterium]|nr:hypothetical protein [Bacteroidales bacterium]